MAKYWDCVQFWQRQGVEKEENLIALALNDCGGLDEHYRRIYADILPTIESAHNKGADGFLSGEALAL